MKLHIQIIGAGAIGLLLTAKLQETFSVTLYVRRTEQKQQLEEKGIHYKKDNQTIIYKNFSVELLDKYESTKSGITFICVKQTAVEDVVQQLLLSVQNNTVIFLQNGMSHVVYLDEFVKSYVGVVEHGATRLNNYTVNHLGEGAIRLASYNRLSNHVNKLLDTSSLFVLASDWRSLLYQKLIINAVINPLTLIFKQKNHCIYKNEHIKYLAKKICFETANVLKLDGSLMWERVINVAKATKDNTSSMLADYLRGEPTEIDAISGYVLANATDPVPYTTFVYHAVLALEGGVDDE